MDQLTKDRQAAAEAAYLSYEFGEDILVSGANGWESTSPGLEMSRVVYVEIPMEDESLSGGSIEKVSFTVYFESQESAVISDVGALLMRTGQEVGHTSVEKTAGEQMHA